MIIFFALLCIISGNQNKICRGAGKRECCLGCCNPAQVQTMLVWTQDRRDKAKVSLLAECWKIALDQDQQAVTSTPTHRLSRDSAQEDYPLRIRMTPVLLLKDKSQIISY